MEFINNIRRNVSNDVRRHRCISTVATAAFIFSLPLYLMTFNEYAGYAAAGSGMAAVLGYAFHV